MKHMPVWYAFAVIIVSIPAWAQPGPCTALAEFSAAASGPMLEYFPPAESANWANILVSAADAYPASDCAHGARVKAVMLHSTAGRLNEGISVADAGLAAAAPGTGRASFANYSISMRLRRAGGTESHALALECAPIAQAGLEGFPAIADLLRVGKHSELATVLPLHHLLATASGSDTVLFNLAWQCANMNNQARAGGTTVPAAFDAFSLAREVVLMRLTGAAEPTHAGLAECLQLLPWHDDSNYTSSKLVQSVLGNRDIPLNRRLQLAQSAKQLAPDEGWQLRIALWALNPQLLNRPQGEQELLTLFEQAEAIRLQAEALAATLAPDETPSGFNNRSSWDRALKAAVFHAASRGLIDLKRCDLGAPAARAFVALYPDDPKAAIFARLLARCP